MATRAVLSIAFIVLGLGTINVFLIVDSTSHSVSDTLRPFLLVMVPVWAVAIWTARTILGHRSRQP